MKDFEYIPKVGDKVVANRKDNTQIRGSYIVGPVFETTPDSCRIITNKGTDIEGDYWLPYSEWKFSKLGFCEVENV